VAQAKAKETISKMLLPRDIETGREKREESTERREERISSHLLSQEQLSSCCCWSYQSCAESEKQALLGAVLVAGSPLPRACSLRTSLLHSSSRSE
jgi:hypothetical protein